MKADTPSGSAAKSTGLRELVIRRVFDAPRELVWKAWTDSEAMQRWFGPKDFSTPVCTIDLRVGGSFHLCMRAPDGKDYWVKGVYREIAAPERLVYADYFSDKDANVVQPTEYGLSADYPLESIVTVRFEEKGGKTAFSLSGTAPQNMKTDEMEQGWSESFDKLALSLEGSRGRLKVAVNPYLNFNGNTEEAFTFYKSVFGGEFSFLQRFKDTPEAGKLPAADRDKIMHIALPLGRNLTLMATDALESMGQKLSVGNNFYLTIEPESRQEADRLFEQLSAGGKVEMAMHDASWGDYFGAFADRFGIQWMIDFPKK